MPRIRALPLVLITAGALAAGCSAPATIASSSVSSSGSVPAPPTTRLATSAGKVTVEVQGDHTLVTGLPDRAEPLRLAGQWRLSNPLDGGAPEGLTPAGALALTGVSAAGGSRFVLLTPPYARPTVVDLPDGFSYDALSPNGSRLYLIERLPPAGSDHYQVRWYDVPGGRLDDAVVVDKTRLGELMAGRPVSRARSADGALVATLYERSGEPPFVHLLNTVDAFAQCLDLPASAAPRGYVLADLDAASLRIADAAGRVRYRADLAAGRAELVPVA